MNRASLARVLGVSVRQIGTLEADRVITPTRRGKAGQASLYDLTDIVPTYLRWLVESNQPEGGELSLAKERAALARAQRERVEFENKERSGELVSREQVVQEGRAFVEGWKSQLRSLARRAAQVGVIDRGQVVGLEALCRETLQAISQWRTTADAEEPAA